jgi:hypothetical protein
MSRKVRRFIKIELENLLAIKIMSIVLETHYAINFIVIVITLIFHIVLVTDFLSHTHSPINYQNCNNSFSPFFRDEKNLIYN